MKPVSNNFRPSLRGIRQLTGIVEYETTDGNEIILTTEDNDEIISEINDLIVVEQSKIQINPSSIKLINPIFDVELFKSVCTGLTIESEIKIPVKTKINAKIGVLVNGEYEFVEYKNYIINDVTYKADTKSYLINAYDKMLESMISYDENPLSITYPITVKNLIIKICQKLNWNYNLGILINEDKIIDNDLYLGQKLTYRDILDDLSQVICANLMFNENEALFAKYVNAYSNSTLIPFTINNDVIINVSSLDEKNIITDADLKDRDVNLGEKYGPVNALTISDNDVVLNNLVDSASISQNGKTEFNIDGNRILISNSDRFIDGMFNFINGLNYYIYDIETVGLLTFEPLDNLLINHNGIYYNCLALYSDAKLTTGLTESSHADKPEINKSEYTANDVNEKRINNALINIDKANAQIVLKVDSNGKIAKIELNGNADEGDTITIDASQLNITASDVINILAGNSINLTSKNITIDSTNFKVSASGYITATGGTIGGFTITDVDLNSTHHGSYTYTTTDLNKIRDYISGRGTLTEQEKKLYDIDGDGDVDAVDYVKIKKAIDNGNPTMSGIVELSSQNMFSMIRIKDLNNNVKTDIGMNGIKCPSVNCDSFSCNSSITINGAQSENGDITVGANSQGYPLINLNHSNGNITCVSLTQTSKEEDKKDFELYKNALKEVMNTDIYKYHFRDEEENDKKHIGFVIGKNKNYSKDITQENDKGVELYSMTSVLWQAVKEQQEIIEKMQLEINNLKEANRNG